ncbi:MAG: NHLP family bacteriocin export ABC transporter peptidase/permease/ATPase subunit [Verrucomicrobiae bacterium]|nr:NHLP family bacteriocin export ABC transporter peptidase/permease/ATPase subunit [Verrucomicrobiae bacterium]
MNPAPPVSKPPTFRSRFTIPKPLTKGRARTPTVFQMEAVECGAAALGIVLGYYGRHVPLEELRVACGVSRDGSKAGNMVKAAANYGLVGHGYKKEPAGLRSLTLPMIVFWNFNHFVVVEGFARDRVYLNDPAAGPRTVSHAEFDQSFTGVALTFAPGPDFKPGGRRPVMTGALWRRLKGSGGALGFVLLAGLALAVLNMIIPVFAKVFVEDYLVKGMKGWVRPLLFGMVLTALLRAPLTWLQQHYLLRLETKLAIAESGRFLWHVLRLPIEFFTQRYAGEISTRVGINDDVAQLLAGQIATTMISLLMIVLYGALLFVYQADLTMVGVCTVVLNLAVLKYVSRKRADLSQRFLMEYGKQMGVAVGGLTCIETLKATGGETDFFSKWAGYQAKVSNACQSLGIITQSLQLGPTLLSAVNNVAILMFGAYKVMQGEMSVGMLVAYQSLMASFVGPVTELVNLGSKIQELQGNMRRLDDVLNNQEDRQLSGQNRIEILEKDSPRLTGWLEFKNVTFGYCRLDPPLLENFSFSLAPGARIALVGPSGCGKSTVARLACGLYQPWDGEILYDGRPIDKIAREVFCNSVASVDQEIFLFEGSVRENLTLWDASVPDFHLLQAARDAAIHDEIVSRSGAYESWVEENGGNFSGGQRQRLEIARALVRNPSTMILDEATSALDPKTEKAIDDHLRRRGCACLIVAHRLSTIRDCDEILVLSNGKQVQRGTHDELRKQEGLYAMLIAS